MQKRQPPTAQCSLMVNRSCNTHSTSPHIHYIPCCDTNLIFEANPVNKTVFAEILTKNCLADVHHSTHVFSLSQPLPQTINISPRMYEKVLETSTTQTTFSPSETSHLSQNLCISAKMEDNMVRPISLQQNGGPISSTIPMSGVVNGSCTSAIHSPFLRKENNKFSFHMQSNNQGSNLINPHLLKGLRIPMVVFQGPITTKIVPQFLHSTLCSLYSQFLLYVQLQLHKALCQIWYLFLLHLPPQQIPPHRFLAAN